MRVVELSTSLPGTRFPVDVSGGVTRFRHRRGELQLFGVEVAGRDVERWTAPRLRGLVGTRTPEVWIEVGRARSTVCVAAAPDAEDAAHEGRGGDPPIVAFDVHALAEGEDLVFVVANARGAGLPAPAPAMAIACLDAALGGLARRSGAVFTLDRAASMLARVVFPNAGARVPATDGAAWSSIGADRGTWILRAARGSDPATPTEDALRAREVAALLAPADDLLVRGDSAGARALYMEALDRAPRHAEIAARIVEIDARMPARAEAALATLVESRARAEGTGGAAVGLLAGELLAHVGDTDAAIASFERAAETETAPALSARAFELAARASRDVEASARWLDRALAHSARATRPRWARVEARLALGRLEDALADVEHLEALARGTRGKYRVWLRAGRAWSEAGLGAHAGAVFERALRYAPEEPGALAGLGVALVGEGRVARGVSLLERALETARERREPEAAIVFALSRALAEGLDDLPTAIAHVASVAATAPEAPLARGLEGRWRARLGDVAGAALAFARLRDLATALAPPRDGAGVEGIVELLLEAAAHDRETRRDLVAAQRHLAAALRLSPHHEAARRAYREAGHLVLAGLPGIHALRDPAPREAALDLPLAPREAPPEPLEVPRELSRAPAMDLALPDDDDEDAGQAARAEELTRRLREAPGDDGLADELAGVLEALGRSHELVALLTGRLEDAPADRRAARGARAKATFERMAAKADAAGRSADAALYRDALEAIANLG